MVSKRFEEELLMIQNDSINGANVLTKKMLELVKQEIRLSEDITINLAEIIPLARMVHPEMASIVKVVNHLDEIYDNINSITGNKHEQIIEILNNLDQAIAESEMKTIKAASEELVQYKSLMTISSSTTVRTAFATIPEQNRSKEIYILESRPKYEGRTLAKQLAGMNYDVKLIVDAAAGHYMKGVEAVIVGADTIFNDGSILNKIGSLSLALFAKEYEIPFIVAASKNKLTTENPENYGIFLQEKPTKEIYEEEIPNLIPKNIYYDYIPVELITKLISK